MRVCSLMHCCWFLNRKCVYSTGSKTFSVIPEEHTIIQRINILRRYGVVLQLASKANDNARGVIRVVSYTHKHAAIAVRCCNANAFKIVNYYCYYPLHFVMLYYNYIMSLFDSQRKKKKNCCSANVSINNITITIAFPAINYLSP